MSFLIRARSSSAVNRVRSDGRCLWCRMRFKGFQSRNVYLDTNCPLTGLQALSSEAGKANYAYVVHGGHDFGGEIMPTPSTDRRRHVRALARML